VKPKHSVEQIFDVATPEILSREDAYVLGLKRYFTGNPCRKGHVTQRLTSCGRCCGCHKRGTLSWRTRNPDNVRNKILKRRYGLTIEGYDSLLVKQNGACALCLTKPKFGANLHVDHDYIIGHVRGLLCPPCNRTIVGMLENSPGMLDRLIAYMER